MMMAMNACVCFIIIFGSVIQCMRLMRQLVLQLLAIFAKPGVFEVAIRAKTNKQTNKQITIKKR